ncbi:MAG: molecular chaperone TorD family protein [Chloroflexi bacterium]|nr:molecular chaperone TorD family protein [Chloroflexota bacterium]
MTAKSAIGEAAEAVAAKGQVYRVLSRMYGPPQRDFCDSQALALLRGALGTLGLDSLQGQVDKLESYLTTPEGGLVLAREYVRLFRGPVKAAVYPYESLHRDGEIMGPSAVAVTELYREAGLAVSNDFRDLPDHVSVELEFMHFLCARQLQCQGDGDAEGEMRFGVLRRSFWKQHLQQWLPGFANRVLGSTLCPFYVALAAITLELTQKERLAF